MIIQRILGYTRLLGKSQGFLGLPVKDTREGSGNDAVPAMQTAWEPTPAELARLNAGGHVVVTILGTAHPALKLTVGAAPDEASPYPEPVEPVLGLS